MPVAKHSPRCNSTRMTNILWNSGGEADNVDNGNVTYTDGETDTFNSSFHTYGVWAPTGETDTITEDDGSNTTGSEVDTGSLTETETDTAAHGTTVKEGMKDEGRGMKTSAIRQAAGMPALIPIS